MNSNLVEQFNPWLIAYECSRNKCNTDEIALILREKLLADNNTEKYLQGLELFKALKSQLPPHLFIDMLRKTLTKKLIDKITGEINCERVIEYYKTSRELGYSLLTILEIYPLLGMKDLLKSMIIGIIHKALEEIPDYRDRLELCRALIHGPIASLPLNELKDILRVFREKLDDKACLVAATDLLVMITQNYPPKSFSEYRDIALPIGELLRSIAEKTLLLLEEDPDTALEIYHQLGLFKTYLTGICRELNEWKICDTVWSISKDALNEMFKEVGKIELFNNTVTENYTSS